MDQHNETDSNTAKLPMPPEELQAGDVLLSLGEGWISELIVYLTGGKYSHSALFDGEKVFEAIKAGVGRYSLEEHLNAQTGGVDAYRFQSNDNHDLGEPGWSAGPIIEIAEDYCERGTEFSFAQLFMLIPLVSLKRADIEPQILKKLLYRFLETALNLVNEAIENEKEPMTCSELVFRCFAEAEPEGKYRLTVPDLDKEKDLNSFRAHVHKHFKAAIAETDDAELKEMIQKADEMIELYFRAKRKKKDQKHKGKAGGNAVAEFVSPKDLRQSPNLRFLGTLRFGPANSSDV